MRFAPVDQATTFATFAPLVPDAAGTFTVHGPSGGTLQTSGAAGYSSLSTTLTAAAAPGARALTVASTAGIVAGRSYQLGGPEETGGEFVTVAAVSSGTALTLVRPLARTRASGTTLASTRVTFTVTAATAATPGRNHHLVWTWASGGETQPPFVLPFDVTRYTPVTWTTAETLRTVDPLASKYAAEGAWLPATLALAWDMLLTRVAAKVPPGGLVGVVDLSTAHAYLALVLLLESGVTADSTEKLVTRYETRFTQELDAVLSASKVDENEDGHQSTSSEPGWTRSTIQLVRG